MSEWRRSCGLLFKEINSYVGQEKDAFMQICKINILKSLEHNVPNLVANYPAEVRPLANFNVTICVKIYCFKTGGTMLKDVSTGNLYTDPAGMVSVSTPYEHTEAIS